MQFLLKQIQNGMLTVNCFEGTSLAEQSLGSQSLNRECSWGGPQEWDLQTHQLCRPFLLGSKAG